MNGLLACRVCLAYDTRLCSINNGQLREIYEKLVEASLDTEDMLPTSVCYICFASMKKILQFRDRSQKANQILLQMISSGLQPSVSSLDMLVKDQSYSMSWTLGTSDIERTTSTSVELEVQVKIESVDSEMDIDGKSDRNEGTAPPEKRKLEENELVNIQTPIIKTEKDEECRENEEDKQKIFYFKKVEMTTSNIISENQNQSAFNKNDTVTPPIHIFTCDLCKSEYQCKILLESHMKKSHVMKFNRRNTITSDLNVANECKRTNLLKVLEIQNNDNRREKDRHKNKRDKTSQYECPYCMKIFTRKFDFTRHVRVHTKEKPFKCDICEKGFSISNHLTRHLSVHTKEKPFKCKICQKGFTQSAHVTRHLRVHTKEKPFKCDICEKSFSVTNHLTRHLNFHTKEKPYKCDICEKYFSQKYNLITHLRVHNKEKPYKCVLCEKEFSQSAHLTGHLRVHTKEKPFKCDM